MLTARAASIAGAGARAPGGVGGSRAHKSPAWRCRCQVPHSADDVNDGATQFFFLTKESEVTPSGTNVLDGRWSVVGYAVDGAEGLADLNAGDVIESVREVR